MKIDIFCIFGPKTEKMGRAQNYKNGQKSIFSFESWKFFSAHLNHLGRQFFCIFYTFRFDQKKWAKSKKRHFHAWPIFSVFGPKMPKISIFMKKSFSNNFSMSNFGQKRFSILLTNTYISTH